MTSPRYANRDGLLGRPRKKSPEKKCSKGKIKSKGSEQHDGERGT
jgi:hypothetical protein